MVNQINQVIKPESVFFSEPRYSIEYTIKETLDLSQEQSL